MGYSNQNIYLQSRVKKVDGPILEIGSRDYGSTASFRDVYVGNEYVGLDLSPGKGVDVVGDLTQGTAGLPAGHFALAICCSVLEHVRKPWIMAENITELMRADGVLYMSVPWVWRYHPYPDDYYRFSWKGIIELFPRFDWSDVVYSTGVQNEFFALNPTAPTIDNDLAAHADTPNGPRKYLPYLMVNMLGRKKA